MIGALILSVVAVGLGLSGGEGGVVGSSSLADRVVKTNTLRIGYVVYPPALIKDPNTGELSGIMYDVVEAAAQNLSIKTEWAEEVGWGSMIEGLKTNRYDIIVTGLWPNSARAREAVFSIPVMYSVVYPYARGEDTRFDADLSRLNSADVTLATIDGEMTTFIRDADYPNTKTYALPQASSVSEALVGVTTGKADATFVELATARDFLKSNPGAIRQVGTTPIRTFENVFAVKRGEDTFIAMWNTALKELIFDGSVRRAVEKYDATDSFLPPASPLSSSW